MRERHRRTDCGVSVPSTREAGAGSRFFAAVIAVFMLLGSIAMASPARADGGQSSDEGYVMVLQALSFLVNASGPDGTTQAVAMVENALEAEDQDGVDVPTLEQAEAALDAGNTEEAQTLLQDSIVEAVGELEPAVGEETGTTVMLAPLPPRGVLSATDWVFLGLSVLVAAGGILLGWIFRPHESLKQLSREISEASEVQRQSVTPTRKDS